jgi:hypothetical protein
LLLLQLYGSYKTCIWYSLSSRASAVRGSGTVGCVCHSWGVGCRRRALVRLLAFVRSNLLEEGHFWQAGPERYLVEVCESRGWLCGVSGGLFGEGGGHLGEWGMAV